MAKFLPFGKTTPEEARASFWVFLILVPSIVIWEYYPNFWSMECLTLAFVSFMGLIIGQMHMYGWPELHTSYDPPLVYGKTEEE